MRYQASIGSYRYPDVDFVAHAFSYPQFQIASWSSERAIFSQISRIHRSARLSRAAPRVRSNPTPTTLSRLEFVHIPTCPAWLREWYLAKIFSKSDINCFEFEVFAIAPIAPVSRTSDTSTWDSELECRIIAVLFVREWRRKTWANSGPVIAGILTSSKTTSGNSRATCSDVPNACSRTLTWYPALSSQALVTSSTIGSSSTTNTLPRF